MRIGIESQTHPPQSSESAKFPKSSVNIRGKVVSCSPISDALRPITSKKTPQKFLHQPHTFRVVEDRPTVRCAMDYFQLDGNLGVLVGALEFQ